MNRELEDRLECFHALKDAPAGDVDSCEIRYRSRLEDISARLKIDKDVLHRMVLRKHLPWLRANTKPPFLPPRA